jgi:nodulation protein E
MLRTAITGLGVVSSLGRSVPVYRDALLAGSCAIGDLTGFVADSQRVRCGAPVRGFEPTIHFDNRTLGQIDRFTQFGAVAAREAWAGAALGEDKPTGDRIGVVIGTAVAGLDILDVGFRRILVDGSRPQPFTVPMTMGSAPASRIAYEVGAKGPTMGVASACASAAQAILQGHRLIAMGLADVMVVGGADSCFADGYLTAWHGLKVLDPEPCRPFSADRRGLSMGEGAGILVLESEAFARRRGARILGFMRGGGMSSDAGALLACDPDGMAAAMRLALTDAGVEAVEIDYINAHGTGTGANDKAEAAAILSVFANKPEIKTSATKSMIGHAMGAGGALEAVATLIALDTQIVPPTINHRAADPACPIDVTPNVAAPHTMRLAVSNSFAFGGLNTSLVFERGD